MIKILFLKVWPKVSKIFSLKNKNKTMIIFD
jgi:hypothetical protein